MTDEQMEKAKKALADHRSKQMRKKILLRIYRTDQQKAERWLLPFRMIHRGEFIPGEAPPSDYYPHLSDIGKAADGSPYHIEDAQRITEETARYYFTRILAYNEDLLKTYAPADWIGMQITQKEADSYLQSYLERIEDYRKHPEQYDAGPHPLQAERYFSCDAL